MHPLDEYFSAKLHFPVHVYEIRDMQFSSTLGEALQLDCTFILHPDSVEVDDDDIPFCDCSGCCSWSDRLDEESECDEMGFWCLPDIERVIFNPPATIVFWADGTKTVVKCMEGEKFEKYAGFAMACMKKLFGSTSRGKAIIKELGEETVSVPKRGLRAKGSPVDEHSGTESIIL